MAWSWADPPLARFRNHAVCIYSMGDIRQSSFFGYRYLKTNKNCISLATGGQRRTSHLTFGQVWGPLEYLPPSMTLTCLSRPTKNSMRCLSRVIKKKNTSFLESLWCFQDLKCLTRSRNISFIYCCLSSVLICQPSVRSVKNVKIIVVRYHFRPFLKIPAKCYQLKQKGLF